LRDAAERIAALSPEQREVLLKELARARQGGAAPPPAGLPPLVPRPAERFAPFPLTDVQEIYWAGRSGYLDLSTPGPGANVYLEYEIAGGGEPFLERLEAALRRLFDRHEILRLTLLPDGRQQLLRSLPPYRIERVDLRSLPPAEAAAATAETRERFRYQAGGIGSWPLFGFRAAFLEGDRIRLHIWLDCWLIDGLSRDNLINDLFLLLTDPDAVLPPLGCTYRDYAAAWPEIRQSAVYRRARAYWLRRVPALPPAPELPLAEPLSPRTRARYGESFLPLLDAPAWRRMKAHATQRGLTPSSPLIAAFIETLRAWSRRPGFTLTLEGTYWPPTHAQLRDIVGNFNTVYPLQADDTAGTFAERTRRLQDQLTEVLEHRAFSGFRVLREIRRQRGGGTASLMPVMFNSLVEYTHPSYRAQAGPQRATGADSGSLQIAQIEVGAQFPQLLLLPAVFEGDGNLFLKLQAVEQAFLPGVVAALRDAYTGLVRRLAEDEAAWDARSFLLTPAAQLAARRKPVPSLAGDRLLALDHALEERPDWVPGRLFRAGPDLGHGDIHPRTGERLLDTGLLGRWLPDGSLEVLGREEEHAVEIAGHPVELRRVEAALERHPRVRAAVAGAWTAAGRRRLAAWIVPADDSASASAPRELAAWLAPRLPGYMVPRDFVFLDELPVTPAGGVDRSALPPPPSPDLPGAAAPPRDTLEEELLGICRELLGSRDIDGMEGMEGSERMGIGDDFFALGGDSFTAVRLLARVEERWGRRDLSSFFLEPTVFHLAGLVRAPRADQETYDD
jgi:condensation domain-containing protein/AMP-binding enzyme/phosphopantetheine binding protein